KEREREAAAIAERKRSLEHRISDVIDLADTQSDWTGEPAQDDRSRSRFANQSSQYQFGPNSSNAIEEEDIYYRRHDQHWDSLTSSSHKYYKQKKKKRKITSTKENSQGDNLFASPNAEEIQQIENLMENFEKSHGQYTQHTTTPTLEESDIIAGQESEATLPPNHVEETPVSETDKEDWNHPSSSNPIAQRVVDSLTLCEEITLLSATGFSLDTQTCIGELTVGDFIHLNNLVAPVYGKQKETVSFNVFQQMDYIQKRGS
ncbi:hypothetical protein RFI_04906, partial [Reticulomyxa filosa]